MTRIVWFRRDLRLADNPALAAACANAARLVCVYVHAPDEEAPWQPGAASRWWLQRSLASLDAELRGLGQRLLVLHDASVRALQTLAEQVGATAIDACALVEPALRQRDRDLQSRLSAVGVDLHRHRPNLLFEPDSVRTAKGDPYRVFTPFWRQARTRLSQLQPLPRPSLPPPPASLPMGVEIATLGLSPRVSWDGGLAANWRPGEGSALVAMQEFLDDEVEGYAAARNRPGEPGTSRLSPHLHFGEITPQQLVWAMMDRGLLERGEAYLRELGWREFCHHLLWHFPRSSDASMDAKFEAYPWQEPPDRALLEAWQQGRTGFPMVDAGMRELWHTGWMHNRVRMIVASLLTKNLRMHWLHGARWFWDTLVDADLANNTAGWQWTAGTGADAAPYFRIFNPVLQGERFDPRGEYVRRWVPELAKVPTAAIHAPWKLAAGEQRDCGIAGTVYAEPLIDLATSRAAALAGLAALRG